MPLVDIPIHLGMVKAVDEVGLTTYNAALQDVYVDELGGVNRRPGLVEFCDLSTAASVDGLFWWEKQDWVVAVSSGDTFKITDSGGTVSQITHDDTDWATGGRVTFADFGTALYGADGTLIKKIPNSGNVVDMADADAPTEVSHVAFMDKYLLANEIGSRNCHRSNVGAPDTWDANTHSSETKYDDLQAIIAEDLQLYMLGDKTLEVWYDDGSTPFVRESQGFVNSGTVAKYSFVYCESPVNTLAWLDHQRNAVLLNGRTPNVMSGTLTKYIQSFSTVSDCKGDFMVLSGRPYYVLHFPSEEKTLVFDFQNNLWYEWGYWDSENAEYDRWRGNCFCLAPAWNFSLVGDRANGKIYKVDNTTYTDDGDTLRSLIRTGHINHSKPGQRKKSIAMNFRLKKTEVAQGASSITLMLRYRDNGQTTWSNQKTITMSAVAGETDYQATIYQLGEYYSRQWEIVLTDDAALSITQMQEEVELI